MIKDTQFKDSSYSVLIDTAEAIESEAIEFAEWLAENHYRLIDVTVVHIWDSESSQMGTTKELYKIFKRESDE